MEAQLCEKPALLKRKYFPSVLDHLEFIVGEREWEPFGIFSEDFSLQGLRVVSGET
jgi:hypothetical protein